MRPLLIKSNLFENIEEIKFGFTTKIGFNRPPPFYFNLSNSVGDDDKLVEENRIASLQELGLTPNQAAYQKQVHSSIVKLIDSPGQYDESDAMITSVPGIGLTISAADCVPIFIYDRKMKVIAAVHSGWKGTAAGILEKTLFLMREKFGSSAGDLYSYIGPCISAEYYEVGREVAGQFESDFIITKNSSFYLDLKKANEEMLLNFGVPPTRIEVSSYCTYKDSHIFHSYRRDGKISGRALGIIALRDEIE